MRSKRFLSTLKVAFPSSSNDLYFTSLSELPGAPSISFKFAVYNKYPALSFSVHSMLISFRNHDTPCAYISLPIWHLSFVL